MIVDETSPVDFPVSCFQKMPVGRVDARIGGDSLILNRKIRLNDRYDIFDIIDFPFDIFGITVFKVFLPVAAPPDTTLVPVP